MQRYDLLNEHIYDRERADEFIWKQTKTLGLSRRQFIQLLAAGAGAAATVNLLPFRIRR
jgi:TAT (twin-arginine translocation) pathway signal sequence.